MNTITATAPNNTPSFSTTNSSASSGNVSPVSSVDNSHSHSNVSLDKYHEPSSVEKLQQQLKKNSNLTLPPISSFDNLIRAAEKQYTTPNGANPLRKSRTSITSTSTSTSTSLSNNNNSSHLLNLDSLSSSNASSTANSRSNSTVFIPAMINTEPLPTHISATTNKLTKPRKKKQCPICFNFYANLSTHKSTHLTPEDRPHRCPICQRGFARNNDLIRHKKRHWKDEIMSKVKNEHGDDEENSKSEPLSHYEQLKSLHQIKGTFKCPFNSTLIQLDMEMYPYKSKPLNFETSSCHQTGVFSRCDTYKNHLKALHFEYPPGTKKKDRNVMPGRCKHCGLKFQNVDTWINDHVGKVCGYTYH